MPRHSSDYRHCDDDRHKRKYDCCKSCYKSKKSSSHRERSDSSISESSNSNSCYCTKCSPETEKPQIVICKKDEPSREHKVTCDKCDKSIVIVINMN